MAQITIGSPEARAVIGADQDLAKEIQQAPAKVAELEAELARLNDEADRFEAIYDELTAAWQELSADPWLAEPLAMLKDYQERARLKAEELDRACVDLANELARWQDRVDEVTP